MRRSVRALATTAATPGDLLLAWGDGFWGLNEFAMQMCLVIVTGSILAESRPFARLLDALAGRPRSPRGAVVVMALALSLLATLYPSWRAARLDPVEALRYE